MLQLETNTNEILLEIYRNPTIDTEGVEKDIANSNEFSDEAPNMSVFKETIVTDEGTLIPGAQRYAPGAGSTSQASTTGETSISDWEKILNPDNEYLIKISQLADVETFRYWLNINWYELN